VEKIVVILALPFLLTLFIFVILMIGPLSVIHIMEIQLGFLLLDDLLGYGRFNTSILVIDDNLYIFFGTIFIYSKYFSNKNFILFFYYYS